MAIPEHLEYADEAESAERAEAWPQALALRQRAIAPCPGNSPDAYAAGDARCQHQIDVDTERRESLLALMAKVEQQFSRGTENLLLLAPADLPAASAMLAQWRTQRGQLQNELNEAEQTKPAIRCGCDPGLARRPGTTPDRRFHSLGENGVSAGLPERFAVLGNGEPTTPRIGPHPRRASLPLLPDSGLFDSVPDIRIVARTIFSALRLILTALRGRRVSAW